MRPFAFSACSSGDTCEACGRPHGTGKTPFEETVAQGRRAAQGRAPKSTSQADATHGRRGSCRARKQRAEARYPINAAGLCPQLCCNIQAGLCASSGLASALRLRSGRRWEDRPAHTCHDIIETDRKKGEREREEVSANSAWATWGFAYQVFVFILSSSIVPQSVFGCQLHVATT